MSQVCEQTWNMRAEKMINVTTSNNYYFQQQNYQVVKKKVDAISPKKLEQTEKQTSSKSWT